METFYGKMSKFICHICNNRLVDNENVREKKIAIKNYIYIAKMCKNRKI